MFHYEVIASVYVTFVRDVYLGISLESLKNFLEKIANRSTLIVVIGSSRN